MLRLHFRLNKFFFHAAEVLVLKMFNLDPRDKIVQNAI